MMASSLTPVIKDVFTTLQHLSYSYVLVRRIESGIHTGDKL